MSPYPRIRDYISNLGSAMKKKPLSYRISFPLLSQVGDAKILLNYNSCHHGGSVVCFFSVESR